eukprot:11864734-Heterocapsa_arctica.AAC.1
MPCLIEEGLRSNDMQYALQQAHDVIDEHMNAVEAFWKEVGELKLTVRVRECAPRFLSLGRVVL